MVETDAGVNFLELSTEITVAWLGNPNTRASAEEVPTFFERMFDKVSQMEKPQMDTGEGREATEFEPAVTVRRSLASKDHIISMIDGKPYKTLKRHLSTHGLTPAMYRERYGLRSDYPMVAESYAEMRRSLAKRIGLGGRVPQKSVKARAPKPSKAIAS